ncbi:MAG: hypothetical protein Q9159_003578 [Coniocarpon cinnabarinum]
MVNLSRRTPIHIRPRNIAFTRNGFAIYFEVHLSSLQTQYRTEWAQHLRQLIPYILETLDPHHPEGYHIAVRSDHVVVGAIAIRQGQVHLARNEHSEEWNRELRRVIPALLRYLEPVDSSASLFDARHPSILIAAIRRRVAQRVTQIRITNAALYLSWRGLRPQVPLLATALGLDAEHVLVPRRRSLAPITIQDNVVWGEVLAEGRWGNNRRPAVGFPAESDRWEGVFQGEPLD